MATIYKRDGIYWLNYTDQNGQRVRHSLHTREKKVAARVKAEIEYKLTQGVPIRSDSPRLIDFLTMRFLPHVEIHCRPSTYRRYQQICRLFYEFLESIEHAAVTLSEIGVAVLEDYKAHRLKKVKPRSVVFELSVLRGMFNLAIDLEMIDRNPTKKVKRLLYTKRQVRFRTPEELGKLFRACEGKLRDLVIFQSLTALRNQEIANLRWSDVDLDRGIAYIRDRDSEHPKTHEESQAILGSQAIKLLRLRSRSSKYVFPVLQNPTYLNNKYRLDVMDAAKKAGLPHTTPNTLRHSYASNLLRNKVGIRHVSKLMRHRDPRTTDIYAHLADEDLREAAEELPYGNLIPFPHASSSEETA